MDRDLGPICYRYREVSLQASARYLDALAAVDDPTQAEQALRRLSTAKKDAAGRSCPGFNPIAQPDADLFKSLMDGEYCLRGNAQPRHPLTKDEDALAAPVRRRSEEGQCQGQPLLRAAACARTDRQDPTHAPLARHCLRPPVDGHVAASARALHLQRLRHCRSGLIFLARDKELTAKESILRPGSCPLAHRVPRSLAMCSRAESPRTGRTLPCTLRPLCVRWTRTVPCRSRSETPQTARCCVA